MRALTLVVLVACGPPAPVMKDAALDSTPPDAAIDAPNGNTFGAPIGAGCLPSPSYLCAFGAGFCIVDRCYRQCSDAVFPRCPSGLLEMHTAHDGADVCYCG